MACDTVAVSTYQPGENIVPHDSYPKLELAHTGSRGAFTLQGEKMAAKAASKNTYDVIIVGGGPAGLFAAYYLSEHSDLRVLLLEKGKGTSQRNCPIKEEQQCVKCKPCNILCGIGGAGLFSD